MQPRSGCCRVFRFAENIAPPPELIQMRHQSVALERALIEFSPRENSLDDPKASVNRLFSGFHEFSASRKTRYPT